MQFLITDVVTEDLEEVLELNESEVPHVGKVDIDRMHWFAQHAHYFRVARTGAQLAAFLIGLRPGTSYDSPNYRWFCDRYEDFAYVDRIAVAAHARRQGLAAMMYDDFAAAMPTSVSIMTCEVNIRPPNEQSMTFHTRLGFRKVGTQAGDDGNKEVVMLLKDLRS
jgi:predicted GNAT superfamily acetyltransferase